MSYTATPTPIRGTRGFESQLALPGSFVLTIGGVEYLGVLVRTFANGIELPLHLVTKASGDTAATVKVFTSQTTLQPISARTYDLDASAAFAATFSQLGSLTVVPLGIVDSTLNRPVGTTFVFIAAPAKSSARVGLITTDEHSVL